MVLKPTLDLDTKTPMKLVASSGAEPPAAIRVAPATSGVMLHTSEISSIAGTKYSSHTMASPTKMYMRKKM
jgi:hypothetical protein